MAGLSCSIAAFTVGCHLTRKATSPRTEPFAVNGLERLVHKPLMTVYKINPGGATYPPITLYEDGLVIGLQPLEKDAAGPDWWVAHLTPHELAEFRERFEATDIDRVPSYIHLVEGLKDGVSTRILFRMRDGWRSVSVYGMRDDGKAESYGMQGMDASSAPDEFIAAYRMLKEFHPAGATPWKPELIEIEVRDMSGSHAPPFPWPREVPAPPEDATTPEKVETEAYRHILPGIHRTTMRMLILRANHAFEFNGRKWWLSMRDLLPEEDYLREVERQQYW
ncbi:hypothetical protein [Pendulispora albinea]|uniref:Uncharacterized protein n=1 Tax=Pendulispora albinea TaxID=2741071 RepID=A0ABZ2LV60_9BACT